LGVSTLKLNPNHSASQRQFQARLQLQRDLRRGETEPVDRLLVATLPPEAALFKSEIPSQRSFASMDELVVAGNQQFEELDNVDFAGFRNDKELASQVLAETRAEVAKFHSEGEGKAFNADVRRVMHARYLQGHGVQVQAHLDDSELARLRKYLQVQDSSNNVADAVRGINDALQAGVQQPQELLLAAEKALYRERGVAESVFQEKFAPHLDLNGLGLIRDFTDSWAVAESGKFLNLAQGQSASEMRNSLANQLLASHGYNQTQALDVATNLSLLRDRNAEGPRTNATLTEVINQAVAAGESDYFVLNTRANQGILREMGAPILAASDEALAEAYPDVDPKESRAIRTRVLRDLLRVLPQPERLAAIERLQESKADLIEAEKVLGKHFGERIREFSGYTTGYGSMGAMQRANLTSALSRLPQEVRARAFDGPKKETLDRLENFIEKTFQVEVHRQAGKPPNGNESYAPFVKDWTVQGMLDVYNALSGMAKDGQVPPGLAGTTTLSFMEGAPQSPSMTPLAVRRMSLSEEPWDRPGSWAHASGKSGFFGECSQDDNGHDQVVVYDDALLGGNGDSAEGVTLGEATIIHELGHAIQLGGTPGAEAEVRSREDQLRMAEWSSLSRWTEPGNLLADGRMGAFEYYYDPTVQVGHRQEIATSYGASDPCEDFAEYTPFFFKDPETAMKLSLEKFLYLNQLVGDYYEAGQIVQMAASLGFDESRLQSAEQGMRAKVAAAPAEAGLVV